MISRGTYRPEIAAKEKRSGYVLEELGKLESADVSWKPAEWNTE